MATHQPTDLTSAVTESTDRNKMKKPRVLWIWDWDERMKWTEVLFDTDNGLVLARFGDERLSPDLYSTSKGIPIRHYALAENNLSPEQFKELHQVYLDTDKSKLVLHGSYQGVYYKKCLNGWAIPFFDLGLTTLTPS